jgi:hypothetical protein
MRRNDLHNGGMTNVDEWQMLELEGRTCRVHRFSISETTVVYEAQMEGEPAVGSDPRAGDRSRLSGGDADAWPPQA